MVRAVTRRIYIDCAFHVCNLVPTMDLDGKRASRRDRFELSEARREGSEGMLRNHRLRPVGAPGQVSAAVAGVPVCVARGLFGNGADCAVGHPDWREADLPAVASHARRSRRSAAGSERPAATSCPTRGSQRHLCRHCGAAEHRWWSVHPKSAGGRLQGPGQFRAVWRVPRDDRSRWQRADGIWAGLDIRPVRRGDVSWSARPPRSLWRAWMYLPVQP